MAGGAVGFWSYVHKDDKGDGGRITALAEDVRERYRIHTSETLELFVDNTHVRWGEAWDERINNAIAGTTFFIPIISPSYFGSTACRKELLKFVREAERLGLRELVMPIYWVTVHELENEPQESSDEAIRIIAEYQRQDFRGVSLEDRGSSAYRKAVAALAAELADRSEQAQGVADVPSQVEPSLTAGAEEDGIMERLASVEDLMPLATQHLQGIGAAMETVNGILQAAGKKIQRAAAEGKGIKAALVITNRLSADLAAPAEALAAEGRQYSEVLGKLDSGVHAQLDLVESHPELTEDDVQYLGVIEGLVKVSREAAEAMQEGTKGAQDLAPMSRSLKAPLGEFSAGLLSVMDGQALIEEWGRRARKIREEHGVDADDCDDDALVGRN